ncbi:alpha/beta hydrolase [Alteribacter natronophilus]|uniref:alpha/beta hydrolase n=1 Tax=Alteribacter natronophilus TaxID=2583810 RepID=UPI00110E0BBD|nr:alpha/beta fold hydrolase [Alteribacter natronophilus]TMW72435.1 alpha/beta fold hydrolase [Alteribacter natronophilus]
MIGCLCIHGFTGTPDEVKDITHHLQKREGWLVYSPNLPGHGSKDGMKEVTYKHWLYAASVAMEELLKRCEKVYVIGFSMGGMLAGFLAAKYPVDRLVLISSSAYYLNPKQLLQDVKDWAVEGFEGPVFDPELYEFYRRKIKDTPIAAAYEFTKVVRSARPLLKDITTPTLIIQGESDELVPPRKSAEYLYEHIQSDDKRVYYIQNAKHYIWFGKQKEELFSTIDSFLSEDKAPPDAGEGLC